MKVVMIGTGYVGLVSGTCFADFGLNVTCVDINEKIISKLNAGHIPIYEPGLKELVKENVQAGRLHFTTSLADALKGADAVFIAVGTPTRESDGHADLKYVYEAARQIAHLATDYIVVVDKSTVPVGTAREVHDIIKKENPKLEFDVVSNPEFLREGAAIDDFKNPDRVVIGAESDRAKRVMAKIYETLSVRDVNVMMTGIETAELIKYAANAFLAVKISFINELADLCEKVDADVEAVAKGMGSDSRIGEKFLKAGPGYGGSCFPKDTLALVKTAEKNNTPISIVETVVESNTQRKRKMAQKIIQACGGDVKGKRISVLGVTFKAETDDMRDSPSLDIIPILQNAGAEIYAYDPKGMDEAKEMIDHVVWKENLSEVLDESDCAVVITEWREFAEIDFDLLKSKMNVARLVDLRNLYDPLICAEQNVEYISVGRKPR